MQNIAALFLRIAHAFITFFILLGCFASHKAVLWVHFCFVPLVYLHWKTNRNRCVLTNFEYRLKGIDPQAVTDEDGFVRSLLKMFMKDLPPPQTLRKIIHGVTIACWTITVLR